MKECKRCLFDESFATIGEHQCEYCDLHDSLEQQSDLSQLKPTIDKIKKKGRGKKYDCIMGISGGIDSSILLYTAVKYWNLKPLVIHFDNNWNAAEAKHNMNGLITKLNVDLITYQVNKKRIRHIERFDYLRRCSRRGHSKRHRNDKINVRHRAQI